MKKIEIKSRSIDDCKCKIRYELAAILKEYKFQECSRYFYIRLYSKNSPYSIFIRMLEDRDLITSEIKRINIFIFESAYNNTCDTHPSSLLYDNYYPVDDNKRKETVQNDVIDTILEVLELEEMIQNTEENPLCIEAVDGAYDAKVFKDTYSLDDITKFLYLKAKNLSSRNTYVGVEFNVEVSGQKAQSFYGYFFTSPIEIPIFQTSSKMILYHIKVPSLENNDGYVTYSGAFERTNKDDFYEVAQLLFGWYKTLQTYKQPGDKLKITYIEQPVYQFPM